MKKKNDILRLIIFIMLLFIIAGMGPSEEQLGGPYSYEEKPAEETPTPVPEVLDKEAIIYRKEETEVGGNPQRVFSLELDLSNSNLSVFPVLSQERIFGFELLSEMNQRHQASAMVNAGFNFSYGQPSGLVIQNGRILSGSIGYGRTLLIRGERAWFQNTPVKVWIEGENDSLKVDRINPYPEQKGVTVYTPEYGPDNRMEGKYTVCVVRNNRVVSASVVDEETEIPKDGFLIADLRTEDSPLSRFTAGQTLTLCWEGSVEQGYQCSGALVEDGVNVAKDSDPWCGNLQIPTPRTAVGLKDDATLIFVVVDGRQPGYSMGVTGRQLAEILISMGVTEAALLDGGASSEMILQNEIVNKPSTGKERLLASGFAIKEN